MCSNFKKSHNAYTTTFSKFKQSTLTALFLLILSFVSSAELTAVDGLLLTSPPCVYAY